MHVRPYYHHLHSRTDVQGHASEGKAHNGRASQGKGTSKSTLEKRLPGRRTCLEGSVYESTRAVPSTHLPWRRPHGACPHATSKHHKQGMLVKSTPRDDYGAGAQGIGSGNKQAPKLTAMTDRLPPVPTQHAIDAREETSASRSATQGSHASLSSLAPLCPRARGTEHRRPHGARGAL